MHSTTEVLDGHGRSLNFNGLMGALPTTQTGVDMDSDCQDYASGIWKDARAMRFFEFCASSFAKNLGLYGERQHDSRGLKRSCPS